MSKDNIDPNHMPDPRNQPPIRGEVNDRMELVAQAGLMEAVIANKNTITASEFRKFLPLFNYDACHKLKEAERINLSREFGERFSIYRPITILSHEKDEQGKFIPLCVLPAMSSEIPILSEMFKRGASLVDMFATHAKQDNLLNERGAMVNAALQQGVARLVAHGTEQQRERDEAILAEFESTTGKKELAEQESNSDDFDWE